MHRISITSFGLLFALVACSSDKSPGTSQPPAGTAGAGTATAGSGSVGTAGAAPGGGGAGSTPTAGAGNATAGAANSTGGTPATGGGGAPPAGGGAAGAAGAAGAVTGPATALVTSSASGYWMTGTFTDGTGTADVTVDDTMVAQNWDGFGAAFNEMGWSYLTTPALQSQALQLLFGTEGTHFAWGRIPMGASDYAVKRYTLDDTGTDVTPDSTESNRPPKDTALAMFSIDHDNTYLLPFIKAAQAVNPALRFWSSPWTPPVWMKSGYDKHDGNNGTVKVPSYFDGGTMTTDAASLTAYAQYFVKFVAAYKAQGITIEYVAPANEPNFEQNYPSCLWKAANFATFIGTYLGPAMMAASPSTKIMLGTMSNGSTSSNGDAVEGDSAVVTAVLGNSAAKGFVSVAGAQWGMLDATKMSPVKSAGLPIWATEHKCGNYPWCSSADTANGCPQAYNSTKAPNDMNYAVESWGYLTNAINTIGVTAYNAWNMVLDPIGKGNDLSRDWRQNALLTVSGGAITQTPTYYVFRHLAQYVQVGAKVIKAPNANTIAFKNPDGSIVATIYNSGAAKSNFTVTMHGKTVQFAMPAAGWATIKL